VYDRPLPFTGDEARSRGHYADCMTTTPPPAKKPLRVVDLVAGLALSVLGALIGLIMLGYMAQLSQLSGICEGVDVEGARCSPGFLGAMTVAGIAIVVFAWFLTFGFFIVRVVRRRVGFFLPLVGIVVMIAGYYLVLIILAASYQPSA
jgi:hypothetical protein